MLPMLLFSCIGLEHLKGDQKILYGQVIQAPKGIDVEKLHELYTQKANRKIAKLPISPLVSIYYFGANRYNQDKFKRKDTLVHKKYDTLIAHTSSQKKINTYQFRRQKKITRLDKIINEGNLWMQWGEPVSIYDSVQVAATSIRFQDYLFSKGYFKNKVSAKSIVIGKLVNVTYKITPGLPYIVDSVAYELKDTTVLSILKKHSKSSFLKKGKQYNEDDFTSERERIDLLLKDNGYFDFTRQYIEYRVDTTTLKSKKVWIKIIINEPSRGVTHKQFKVDSVVMTTDVGVKPKIESQRTGNSYRSINFYSYKQNYSLKILSQRVFVFPDDVYNRSKTIKTQQQLANLDAFKFVNLNYDTSGGKFIAKIFTSPLERYQWSNEAGVNVTQGFPGPFDNVSFKKRNVFKGLETFELSGRFGFEGVASATKEGNIYKSTEAGINGSLTFPQFVWPFREATKIKLGQYNPKTKISTGYAYTDRPEYKRTTTSVNYNYSWENGRSRRFDFTIASLNIINSEIKTDAFETFLKNLEDQGNNLKRSFNPSFVSSMIFSMTWNHNNYGNKDKSSIYFRWQVESGGTLQNLFNYKFIDRNGLQTYRYLRLNLDFRKNIVLNKNTTIAYRLNGGIAYSYDTIKALPYEKYFFAGGSNGIRAWRPRRLGEGSLKPIRSDYPEKDGLYSYSFEKPGDMLLEGSLELRKHIFGFIEGAVFVDAGNVWYLFPQKNINPELAGDPQFKFQNFFKQIAVGTGFGLRFDFSFLIIRLDVGMKVLDPARDDGDHFVLDRIRFFKPYATNGPNGYYNFREPVIYNFGIGYPF
jgi:hypothetical protein